jgi:hypothetical protein
MEAWSRERQIEHMDARVTTLDRGAQRNSRSHGGGSRGLTEKPASSAKRIQGLYRIVLGCACAGARGPAPV